VVVRQIQPTVKGRETLVRNASKNLELQQVNVEMDKVKLVRTLPDLIKHDEKMSGRVANAG